MGILDEYYGKKSAQSATSEESATAFDPERYSHIKPLSDFAAPVEEEQKPRTNTPGLMSDIKRASGQFISGAGSTLRDIGAEQLGGSIEQYGTGIVQRNPSEITSFGDVLSRPFTTAREAVGEVAPQVGLAVGGQVAGRVVGGALGLPFGPAGVAVGQQVGGFVGGLLPAAVQTYGGIRSEQREKGIEEKGRALAVTIPAALLERFGGAERVALRVAGEGTEFLARELGTNAYKAAAKQFARGGVEELVTELPQTALERYGVTGEAADLASPEAMNEYGVAGAKAFLGGGAIRTGLSVAAGTRKDPMVTIQPDGTITSDQPLPGADGEVDLTNPNNVVTTAADAAKKLSEFDPYAVIAERAAAGRPMSAEEATQFLSSSLAAQKAGQQYIDLMQSKEETLGRIGQVGEQYQRMVGRRGDQLLGVQEAGDLARPIVSRLQDETQQQEAPYIAAAQVGAGAQQLPGLTQGAGTKADYDRIMNPDVMEPVEPQGYEPLARTDLLPAQPAPFSNMRLDRPGPQESLTGPTSQLSDRPVTPEPAPASPLAAQATTLPPAPAAGGVSSTPATTTQDGAQTTQAKQTKAKKQKAPVTAGSVVKVNDTEVTLDEAQAVAWNKAQEAYEGKARRARELTNYQERESGLRAAGMQLSAERRKITGALTAKEQQAAKRVADRQTAEQKAQDEMGLTAALQTANRTNVANNPLQAGVEGADKKPVPGKASLTVNSLRNIRDALLNPSATVEGISDQEQQIADAVRAFAKSYYKFSNAGGNMLRGIPTERPIKGENGETIYKPTKLAGQTPAQQRGQIKAKTAARVSTTVDHLEQTRQALAGLGKAVNGNAKDVEAIVKLVKDMVQKKLYTEVMDTGMNEDFGQYEEIGPDGEIIYQEDDYEAPQTSVASAFKKLDTMLSQAWRAAKGNMFQGESDAAFVRQTPIRNSREATAAGNAATPLEKAARNGYAVFNKGARADGMLGVLNYIQTHGTPFERTIAKGVFESLDDSDTAPNIEFITEGKPYYDPKTNTVYIQRDASAAVTLHEALHSALQWYVYQNPDAPEVRALKAALKRVVNFKGELSTDAKRVQDVLKTLMKDKKELDAVLELVSYGNTLNDFRRALEGMSSTEAPKSFYDAAKNVWQAILTTVQKLVGVRPSVAADVIGNTFKLLEAAGAGKKGANVGNVLKAEVESTGAAQPKVTPLDLRIYNKKVAPAALSTKFVFDLVGWQRGAAKVGELSSKLATTIRKDFPTAERYITYLNSTFGVNVPTVDAMRNYKVDKNTGYQRMEQLANFVESRSAEEANALFDYLDGNKKALDKFPDADKMKEIADSVEKSMALYISQLPEKDKAYFENTKFSESLLFAGNTNQVASHTFGARKLSEIIGLQHRFEPTIDFFQHWMGVDQNGDVDITGPFYQVFGPNVKDPAGPQGPQG